MMFFKYSTYLTIFYFCGAFVAALVLGVFVVALSVVKPMVVFILVLLVVCVAAFSYSVIKASAGNKIWILVYLAILCFFIEFSIRPPGQFINSGLDFQSYMRLIIWGGGLIIGVLNYSCWLKKEVLTKEAISVLLLAVFAVFSTIYSFSPMYTFGASVALVSYCVFSLVVVSLFSLREILIAAVVGIGVLVVLSVVIFAIAPEYVTTTLVNGSTRFRGFSGSPNSMGRLASLLILFLLILRYKNWLSLKFVFPLLVISSVALVLAESRVAGVAVVISFVVSIMSIRVLSLLGIVSAISATLLGLYMLNFSADISFLTRFTRSGDMQEIYTVSNRTDIWSFAIGKIIESPWLGYGYGATRWLMPAEYATVWGYTVTSAHNLILQSFIMLGAVGSSFVIFMLVMQLINFYRKKDIFCNAIFIYVVLTGITEAGAIGITPTLLTLFWVLAVILGGRVAKII